MTYRPGGNNHKSIQEDRVKKAIGILEEAYITGSNVRIENAFSGATVVIDTKAIPFFVRMLIEKVPKGWSEVEPE
jgi:hypothetical protein